MQPNLVKISVKGQRVVVTVGRRRSRGMAHIGNPIIKSTSPNDLRAIKREIELRAGVIPADSGE